MSDILLMVVLMGTTAAATNAQVTDSVSREYIDLARQSVDTGLVIQFKYGFGRMQHIDLIESYATNRLVEFHVGIRNWQSIDTLDIPGLRQTSIFYGTAQNPGNITTLPSKRSRFGLRTATGYGWANSSGMLLPYNSTSLVWTKQRKKSKKS